MHPKRQGVNETGSTPLTETKGYVYDPAGRRATLTDTPVGGSTSRYSYAYDPHGSVELLIDENRTVKASYGYSAYGSSNLSLTKTASGFTANTNLYRYDGQRFDTGSNTVDFAARRYSPSTERFIQRDSYFGALDDLGLSTDPLNGNRYALTGANPINFVEYDGHHPAELGQGEFAAWQFNGTTFVTYGTAGSGAVTTANYYVVAGASDVISHAEESGGKKKNASPAQTATVADLALASTKAYLNSCRGAEPGGLNVCAGDANDPYFSNRAIVETGAAFALPDIILGLSAKALAKASDVIRALDALVQSRTPTRLAFGAAKAILRLRSQLPPQTPESIKTILNGLAASQGGGQAEIDANPQLFSALRKLLNLPHRGSGTWPGFWPP